MIELTLIIINLLQQLSCQMILLNETNLSQKDIYQFDNFIPQGFYLKIGEVILFSLSSLDNSENQPIMELCTDQYKAKLNCFLFQLCLKCQNCQLGKHLEFIQNIIQCYSFQLQCLFRYKIQQFFQSSGSNYQILKLPLVQICNKPSDCKNGGICSQGICICPQNYFSHDCSVIGKSILETSALLNSQFYFFDIYEWMEKEQKLTQYYFARLEEQAVIIVDCYANNPYLLQNTTEKQLSIINITVDEMYNCLNYVNELEQNSQQQFAKIIIKLKEPFIVKFKSSDSQVDPFVIGIVIGSISLFIMIVVIYCIYRCKKDDIIQKKKKEEKERIEKEKKLMEEKENQMMPEFSYAEILQKFPGLKNEQECEICLNAFKVQERVKVTYCTHIFHADCLKQWLNKHQTCPMCRENLNVNQLVQSHLLSSSDHQGQHISENQQAQFFLLTPKSQHNTRLYGDEHQIVVQQFSEQVDNPQNNNNEEDQNKQIQMTK
ncbi:unnamed protein product [Paramecium octaurelia]|uniref:RING-type domain-containing protein n=1 Tax=Paramecium octaurelia TaxID=43137 RepID=A0A8S1RX95_PAROT|nr:unnamed protein product [Paramecium octaurelia]